MSSAGIVHVAGEEPFLAARLETVFNDCFAGSCNTRLCGGVAEPLYRPAVLDGGYHALYYRSDYFASALHEVAHWCIAGVRRRQQPDFGYWYSPDGRSADQQRAFEAVEYKPQALEWFFSKASGYRFQVSADNLDLAGTGMIDTTLFQRRVLEQALTWQKAGLPPRADEFYRALCREFDTCISAAQLRFTLEELVR
ncbi:MAG TPA: elongation factor P hydroxylase [Halioglobus sp.]